MSDLLQKICADKRTTVEKAKILSSLEWMNREALRASAPRGFGRALRAQYEREGAAFIAEIKKASPSSGIIRNSFSAAALAADFCEGGAACLSVLTDQPYFQGHPQDLIEARSACRLPVLNHDFFIDPWQVAEARALGADCIAIIMAAIDDPTAAELHHTATLYGMDVILEIHTKEELARALKLRSSFISVNSCNLKTLKIDIRNAAELMHQIPAERFVLSQSGITTRADVLALREAGARGFIIGEALLKQNDVARGLRELRGQKN